MVGAKTKKKQIPNLGVEFHHEYASMGSFIGFRSQLSKPIYGFVRALKIINL